MQRNTALQINLFSGDDARILQNNKGLNEDILEEFNSIPNTALQNALFSGDYAQVIHLVDDDGIINLGEYSENDPVLFEVMQARQSIELEKILSADKKKVLAEDRFFSGDVPKMINNISDNEVQYVDYFYNLVVPKFPEEFISRGYIRLPQYLERIKELKNYSKTNDLTEQQLIKYLGRNLPNNNYRSGYYFHYFNRTRNHLHNLIAGDSRFCEAIQSVKDKDFTTQYNK